MASQCVNRIVVAFQLFIRQHGVYILVAGCAHTYEALTDLCPAESPLVFSILVARPRNQVVYRELRHLATTQLERLYRNQH
jgi:hypothetical protein